MEEIINLIAEKKFSLVTEILDETNSVDIANFLETLDNDRLLIVFRLLKTDAAAEVFSYVSPEKQREIIESTSDKGNHLHSKRAFHRRHGRHHRGDAGKRGQKNTQVRKAGKARADKQISPLSRQKRRLDNDARVSRPQGGGMTIEQALARIRKKSENTRKP